MFFSSQFLYNNHFFKEVFFSLSRQTLCHQTLYFKIHLRHKNCIPIFILCNLLTKISSDGLCINIFQACNNDFILKTNLYFVRKWYQYKLMNKDIEECYNSVSLIMHLIPLSFSSDISRFPKQHIRLWLFSDIWHFIAIVNKYFPNITS